MIGLAEYEPAGIDISYTLKAFDMINASFSKQKESREEALKSILGKAVLALNANTKPTQAQFDAMMEERKAPDGRTIWYWGGHPILMEMPDGTIQLP